LNPFTRFWWKLAQARQGGAGRGIKVSPVNHPSLPQDNFL
jgi:hypothetical protein